MPSPIRVLLFDVDGVVVNKKMFSEQYQEDFGISNDALLPFFRGVFQKCVIGKTDILDAVQPYLKDWKWEKSADEFLHYWFEAENKPNLELLSYIETLRFRGIRCSLATNQEIHRLKYLRETMKMDTYFTDIFASCLIGSKKPEKEFFENITHTLGDAGYAPDSIMLIDDTGSHIEQAIHFGIRGFQYTGNERLIKYLESLTSS